MTRFIAVLLLLAGNAFGQATDGNEKYDQQQYADAANAYEKIPANQRDARTYNRLGISYHLSNQLRAAETAYRSARRLEPENADVLNNLSVLFYSQRKFADAEREVRQAIEKSPDNPIMRLNLRAARYARENARNARGVANSLAPENPQFVEKRENDLLQMQILMRSEERRG